MADAQLVIKFDGGDAANNAVDMRLLGQSLQGLERIISDGVILISARRPPKRGERAPLIVKAKEAQVGSHTTPAFLAENSHLLQLGWSLLTAKGDEIILNWVSFVLKSLGGDKAGAEKHLEALMETQRLHVEAGERADERRHAENEAWRVMVYKIVDRLAPSGVQAVAPVGPSVRTLNFASGKLTPLVVDEPTADVIRSRGELELGLMQSMVLRTDGFTYNSRKLMIEHPEEPGRYMTADVQDPIFEQQPNPYTDAAGRKALIAVKAKPGLREGKLKKLYIMDFEGEVDDNPS